MLRRSTCLLILAFATPPIPTLVAADPPTMAQITLSPNIPGDFFSPLVGSARDLDGLQHDFDVYSWQTFIALNWPVTKSGEADVAKKIGADAPNFPVVWESWRSVDTIFLKDGSKPAEWEHKGRSSLTYDEPFDTGPVVDQNGRYVRFEILLNREMFEYIRSHELYSTQGQANFKKSYGNVVFPCGRLGSNPEIGSIVIKAAWKILSEKEIASGHFLTRKSILTGAVDKKGGSGEHPAATVLGLVGLHIMHKSEDVPEWNWSTFEQVDNVPELGTAVAEEPHSFFFNDPKGLPVNVPPDRPWDPETKEGPERRSRLVRITPLTDEVRTLNSQAHALLRQVNPKTVWQYYQLVSTQWPTRPARAASTTGGANRTVDNPHKCDVLALSPADILGGPAPVFLANTTLETYIQGQVPNTSSSCMDCHANATSQSGEFSDFTYILIRASRQTRR